MIVYLLLNTVTEMGYVGSTESTLESRFDNHWKARNHKDSELALAMRATVPRQWLRVVLEEYDDVRSMCYGEVEWMHELETTRLGVGYNRQIPSAVDIEQKVKRSAGAHAAIAKKAPRTREHMTAEELEYYREQGRLGAAKSAALPAIANKLTREERVVNGKLGAEALWSRPDAKELHKDKILPAMKAGHKSWWDSLSEEEKERRREMGRQAGKLTKGGGRPKKAKK